MVCVPDQLPLLKLHNQEVVSYELSWISGEITKAVQKAGFGAYLDFFVVDHLSHAVGKYLTNIFPNRAITIDELQVRIEAALLHLDMPQVAENLVITPPPLKISLLEIAERSAPPRGHADIDTFLNQLSIQLDQRGNSAQTHIHCEHLDAAIERLSPHGWTESAEDLSMRITGFVDAEVHRRYPEGFVSILVLR